MRYGARLPDQPSNLQPLKPDEEIVPRDADTIRRLLAGGWLPVRVWEHEDPTAAAERIAAQAAERAR